MRRHTPAGLTLCESDSRRGAIALVPLFQRAALSIRFLLLAVGIGAAIVVGAHPVGLLIGLSLIVPATLLEAWRTRPPVVEGLPALAPDDPSWDRWDPWLARERGDDDVESP